MPLGQHRDHCSCDSNYRKSQRIQRERKIDPLILTAIYVRKGCGVQDNEGRSVQDNEGLPSSQVSFHPVGPSVTQGAGTVRMQAAWPRLQRYGGLHPTPAWARGGTSSACRSAWPLRWAAGGRSWPPKCTG